jgi:hypothetical protein
MGGQENHPEVPQYFSNRKSTQKQLLTVNKHKIRQRK